MSIKSKTKYIMETIMMIAIIEEAFHTMEIKQEKEMFIKHFSCTMVQLPKTTLYSPNGFLMKFKKEGEKKTICLVGEQSFPIIFMGEGRKKVVETLQSNNMLPSKEEILEARSLTNTLDITRLVDCDYEDTIT